MKEFTPLDRHEYIFHKILKNEEIKTSQIAEYCYTDIKTIRRDLKNWISPLFEEEIYSENNKWVIPEPVIDIKFYEPSELAAIAFIFKYMDSDNPQLYSKTVSLFNELHEKLSHSIYKQSSIEDILAIKKEEFYKLKSAIDQKKEIRFKFFEHNKFVQPLKIANIEKYWYLLCYDKDKERFSKFSINGIREIVKAKEEFDPNIHPFLNKLDNAINAFFNADKEIEVILKLDWEAKKVLSRKRLNLTQNIIQNEDDEYIMTITVTHLMEIIPTIQQWIPFIEVISPQVLKDKIKKNLEKYQI